MAIHARPAFFGVGNETASGNAWVGNGDARVQDRVYTHGFESGFHGCGANLVFKIQTVDGTR
jgi:hypothetical protein